MRKLASLTAAAALVAVFGFAGTAWADAFADAVDSFTPPTGCKTLADAGNGNDCDISGDDENAGADAEGPDNSDGASLGFTTDADNDGRNGLQPEGGVLVLNFTDNFCLNLTGDDIDVFEIGNDESYDISVGIDNFVALVADGSGTGDDTIDVNSAGLGAFNQISLTATDGQGGTTSGADIDAVECLFPFDQADIEKVFAVHGDDPNPADFDEIDQTDGDNDGIQFKAFEIVITNNTGVNGGLSGLTFIDVVPAEWDLDPLEEDDVNACDGAPEVCDGVDVTAADDDVADCTATGAEHTNNGNGPAKLQPDIITMTAGGLANGDSCTITVWVTTDDDHPGKGRVKKNPNGRGNPDFTPTSCPVTLNDGVKVFDGSMNLLLQDDDTLIFGIDQAAADADPNDGIGFCNPV